MQKNKHQGDSQAQGGRSGFMIDMGGLPIVEMLGNRRVTIEGSAGILLYKSDNIKINTCSSVISIVGRGLTLKCISCSCVEIEGFVTDINFAL